MRVIHTSDWHLGQTFRGFDRTYEHEAFLDWLLATLVSEAADALIVAGDIFDSANPPAACQKQLYRFLARVRQACPGLDIVLVAGNHDSAYRLEAPAPLLESFRVHIVGLPRRHDDGTHDLSSLVIPLRGPSDSIAAWCLAIPFLRPADVPRVEDSDDPYAAGVAALYQSALREALARRSEGQAIIATGHCHITGGRCTDDSERRLIIGGAEAMSADVFGPEIAYVALGHLHLAQHVAGATRRYSGSPLPLSFAEITYPHQIVRIDLDGESVGAIESIRVPRSVALLRVPQAHARLPEVLQALQALDLPDVEECCRPYLEACILADGPEPDLRARIDEALAGKPVRFCGIHTQHPERVANAPTEAASLDALERLDPADVFARLYRDSYGTDVPADVRQAFAEVLHEEESS